MKKTLAIISFCCFVTTGFTQSRFLFDATKAEMAGNADWVIDADLHNLVVSSSTHLMVTGSNGNQSNPQRIPTPAASGITSSTSESYWTGALSAWAVELVKRDQIVETLPYNGSITYNNSSNAQDLSHYNVFVVCEPNIAFTATEKTAILNFVQNGGSLFMISDHNGSDRNNDGIDSPHIWNDLMQTNSVHTNPFGITYNNDDVSPDSHEVDTAVSDSIIHGPAGNCSEFVYHDGSTITISTSANSSVRAAVWNTSSHVNSNVIVAYARFGNGKVVTTGDSSPVDDGTGDPNDGLYNGWSEGSGNDGVLFTNASMWLATTNTTGVGNETGMLVTTFALSQNYPDPFNATTVIRYSLTQPGFVSLSLFDRDGRMVREMVSGEAQTGQHEVMLDAHDLASGTYFYRLKTNGEEETKELHLVK